MGEPKIRTGDWVLCKSQPQGQYGYVTRAARDGSWADVRWCWSGGWVKRMKAEHLTVTASITLVDGTVVTDWQRERELTQCEYPEVQQS